MARTSNRELARQLGVSETAVRGAERAGRITREADGAWDPGKVKAAWADNTDQVQQRPPRERTDPVRHKPGVLGLTETGSFSSHSSLAAGGASPSSSEMRREGS